MKLKWNKRYLKISAYAVGTIVISGVLLFLLANLGIVGNFINVVADVTMPVILGLVFAYILNPLMQFFELKVFRRWQVKADTRKEKKKIRSVSLIITVILTLAFIIGFFSLVLPQLTSSVLKIGEKFDNLPAYFNEAEKWIGKTFGDNTEIGLLLANPLEQLGLYLGDLWNSLEPNLLPLLTNMGNGMLNIFTGFLNFFIGFIIGVNMLFAKDMLLMQTRKFMFAFFKGDFCAKVFEILAKSNKIFKSYMVGLFVDAFFVGFICFVGCSVMGMPVPILIAMIIAITNFIPFFGPFLGAVPCAFLILMDDPLKALWFIIFIVILQQFDGNIMVPFIQGDATGVPSVWILMSIIVGGGLFGFVGMLVSVPVFAVIYMLCKEFIESRLKKKTLPVDSYSYEEKSDYLKLAVVTGGSDAENIIAVDSNEENRKSGLFLLLIKIRNYFKNKPKKKNSDKKDSKKGK